MSRANICRIIIVGVCVFQQGVAADVFLSPSVQQMGVMPTGVNFGGWLCLEDWFYSGVEGKSVSTGTNMPHGQGACLPPAIPQLSEKWPSEGALVKMLNDTIGFNKTIDAFMSHRRSFIGTHDLETLQSLGIHHVRVPITWAVFADALAPISKDLYGAHNAEDEAVIVPDPFYVENRALVTVPRSWLRMFLRKAAQHGIRIMLDLHAFPGASSDGTYNGVWPLAPAFWKNASAIGQPMPLTQAGQLVVQKMIDWVEGLTGEERRGVGGLLLMNEPAHLSAGKDWAEESQVLAWLSEAAGRFRNSSLPRSGVKLYMNVIETAFENFWTTIPAWYEETFSRWERHTWSIMDIHWYSAWGGDSCSGRTVNGGAYYCDQPIDEVRSVMAKCISDFTDGFSKNFTGLKAVSEFSLGTFDQAQGACIDPSTLQAFLEEQVFAMDEKRMESFFWTWRMPYGPSFEPGWSFKRFLGREVSPLAMPCLAPTSSEKATSVEL